MPEPSALPPHLADAFPLPGGHPHSLPLLIWIETGVVGASLAAGLLLTTLRRLRSVPARSQQGALLALMVSYLLIFDTNFPAWEPALQMLTYVTVGLVNAVLSPCTSTTSAGSLVK
jgi:O-antigen ligase